ncbi:MAG TPA: glycosyltransferase 87 family protein, partial [Vicinamibacterales bacterium]|nr:glycosyltransferase 87 family protein [Vicinamibacterales bacterium]
MVGTAGPLDRFGTLKGTDFSQFYVSARLVATGHPADLYDWATYTRVLANQVPGPEGLLYLPVYPPVLALLLAPLGLLPYLFALATWTAISAAAYLAAGTWLVAKVPGLRRDPVSAGLLLIAFPAFQQLLLYGQVSALAMLLVAAGWRGWTTGHNALAGVALGALVFKPQMLCLALSASLLAPGWALIGGAAIAIAIELLGTGLLLGPD